MRTVALASAIVAFITLAFPAAAAALQRTAEEGHIRSPLFHAIQHGEWGGGRVDLLAGWAFDFRAQNARARLVNAANTGIATHLYSGRMRVRADDGAWLGLYLGTDALGLEAFYTWGRRTISGTGTRTTLAGVPDPVAVAYRGRQRHTAWGALLRARVLALGARPITIGLDLRAGPGIIFTEVDRITATNNTGTPLMADTISRRRTGFVGGASLWAELRVSDRASATAQVGYLGGLFLGGSATGGLTLRF